MQANLKVGRLASLPKSPNPRVRPRMTSLLKTCLAFLPGHSWGWAEHPPSLSVLLHNRSEAGQRRTWVGNACYHVFTCTSVLNRDWVTISQQAALRAIPPTVLNETGRSSGVHGPLWVATREH